jgi:hypothetical protein
MRAIRSNFAKSDVAGRIRFERSIIAICPGLSVDDDRAGGREWSASIMAAADIFV